MSLGNILQAINTSYGAYNGNTADMYDAKVKGAQYKDTLMNTKLKNQSHSQNELMNPMLAIAQELTNKINNQSFDFNAINNPYLIDKNRLGNATTQQSLDYNALMNPLNIEGKGYDNTSKQLTNTKSQNQIDSRNAFITNPLNNAQTVNAYHGTAGNSQYNPTNANKLNMGQTLVDIATGGGNPVTYQGQKFEGQDQLDELNKVIRSLMTSGKGGGSTKPTFVYDYDEMGNKTSTYNYDPTTNSGTKVELEGATQRMPDGSDPLPIAEVLNKAMNTTFGTGEFNETANQADFNIKANEAYQFFLGRTNDPAQAQAMTQTYMFKQLGLDGDNEFGFLSDKELDYTPNNEPFGGQQQQLPVGTIRKGYRFKGGEVNNKDNWEKI